jgi:hypothetical protein
VQGGGIGRSRSDLPLARRGPASADEEADEHDRRFDRYLAIDEESE